MTTPTTETELADTAYESIRSINHRTITARPIPAPEMYSILGNLKCLGHGLDQALQQLSTALELSLATHAVYETDGGDPTTRTAWAMGDMQSAAEHAAAIGVLLESAQGEIAQQAYHPKAVTS